MTGIDFLTVAKELSLTPSPAQARTAISRAYYAAFHTARELLERGGFNIPKNDASHAVIARWLAGSAEPHAAEAARHLEALRSERYRADYDLKSTRCETDRFAQQCVCSSEAAIDALLLCDVEPVRSALIQGIRDYQSKVRPPLT